MKLLTFQARRFRWKTFSKTLEAALDEEVEHEVEDAVVVFLHAEAKDAEAEEQKRVVRTVAKHVKWIANKRGDRCVVLHSFTHLGADSAEPDEARALVDALAEKLAGADYEVHATPFGWFCEWDLSVRGDSLAKVWKEV